ncbi:hypothetical protein C5167_009120 [Papaver somniferum]|uniref:Uncharacterized protein n=1 Tax=Papaver somniferum TaxID=3469 RepID=A0A4Y7JXK1_PAPSO|nr:hypothetical protein C5167_009120 [Papaver somniferum]
MYFGGQNVQRKTLKRSFSYTVREKESCDVGTEKAPSQKRKPRGYWNGDLPLPFPSRFLSFSLPIRTNKVVEDDPREKPQRRIQFQSKAV